MKCVGNSTCPISEDSCSYVVVFTSWCMVVVLELSSLSLVGGCAAGSGGAGNKNLNLLYFVLSHVLNPG